MGAQDKTEKVLRELHVLLSKSEAYEKDPNRVIVNKKEMLDLLKELNLGIYEIMDEYELTKQSRDQAERAARKAGEDIIWDANQKAEDVYAASVLYTDEALKRVLDIMQETSDSVKAVFDQMDDKMKKEKQSVSHDQLELKSHLQDLQDTKKYLSIIDDRNKKIAKEKKWKEEDATPSPYAAIKPEIRINQEYFEQNGLSLEDAGLEEADQQPDEKMEKVTADVSVNLDSEYFKWKENPDGAPEEKKPEKHSLFSKILKDK